MRKWLIGLGIVLIVGMLMLLGPYRAERITGVAANNRTGCTIRADNSSGWTPDRPTAPWEVTRMREPLSPGVAVYECGGLRGQRPAAMTLVAADGQRIEGCASSSDIGWCYAPLDAALPVGGAPQRYRLLIQVRAGEPVHAIDFTVTREVEWRSGAIDGIMSV